MNSAAAKTGSATTRLYCAMRARVVARRGRQLGQGLVEYLGLIVIVAGALALAQATGDDGPLVAFFRNAVQGGLTKALNRLGITPAGGGGGNEDDGPWWENIPGLG